MGATLICRESSSHKGRKIAVADRDRHLALSNERTTERYDSDETCL